MQSAREKGDEARVSLAGHRPAAFRKTLTQYRSVATWKLLVDYCRNFYEWFYYNIVSIFDEFNTKKMMNFQNKCRTAR